MMLTILVVTIDALLVLDVVVLLLEKLEVRLDKPFDVGVFVALTVRRAEQNLLYLGS